MKPITAVEVLRAAVRRSEREPVRTKEVRAALKSLLPYVQNRYSLDTIWDFAAETNPIARNQNVRRGFRGLLRELGLPDE